jgi:hypothetical protein
LVVVWVAAVIFSVIPCSLYGAACIADSREYE